PASPAALAAALTPVPFEGATVAIIPGLTCRDDSGIPEVMRGEETQLAGAIAGTGDGTYCLPGTHSKWATVHDGAIANFSTAMTGEVFAALRSHTILGRMMTEGPPNDPAFTRGVTRASAPGGILHHLFGVRTLGLFDELEPPAAASYLSGLLIGHELAAIAPTGPVHLVGDPALCRLYAQGLAARSIQAATSEPDRAAAGIALIAEYAGWI
ncbi:MAG: 2-dehydro-3-deoxygalactonokinase, partial [Acetobacteraceae bacterium]|nr:2-dehydro-3-deoxygalactonokinase [Acetobacteraceae bacterium]